MVTFLKKMSGFFVFVFPNQFLFCAFKGFGATVNVAKPKKGSSVAIFGLGAVGLAVSHSYALILCYVASC